MLETRVSVPLLSLCINSTSKSTYKVEALPVPPSWYNIPLFVSELCFHIPALPNVVLVNAEFTGLSYLSVKE